jgi:hypothetical protein
MLIFLPLRNFLKNYIKKPKFTFWGVKLGVISVKHCISMFVVEKMELDKKA